MSITALSRKFWIDTVLDWAENRLPGPQLDECRTALDFDVLMARAETAEAALAELAKLRQAAEVICKMLYRQRIAYAIDGEATDADRNAIAALFSAIAALSSPGSTTPSPATENEEQAGPTGGA